MLGGAGAGAGVGGCRPGSAPCSPADGRRGGKEAMQVPGVAPLPSPPQCGRIPSTNTPPGTPRLRALLSAKENKINTAHLQRESGDEEKADAARELPARPASHPHAGQQLRPPAPIPPPPGKGQRTPVLTHTHSLTRTHTNGTRGGGKFPAASTGSPALAIPRETRWRTHRVLAPAPNAAGQRARGRGPGAAASGQREPPRLSPAQLPLVPGTAAAGQRTGTPPPPRRRSRGDPCRWAATRGCK